MVKLEKYELDISLKPLPTRVNAKWLLIFHIGGNGYPPFRKKG